MKAGPGLRTRGFESLSAYAIARGASIVVMLGTLNPESRVRFPGALRAKVPTYLVRGDRS